MADTDAPSGLQNLADQVIAARHRRGWETREQFAQHVDVSYRILSDLENAKRPLGADTYAKVEEALGWPPGAVRAALAGHDVQADELRYGNGPGGLLIREAEEALAAPPTTAGTLEAFNQQRRELADISIRVLRTQIEAAERLGPAAVSAEDFVDAESLAMNIVRALDARADDYEQVVETVLDLVGRVAVFRYRHSLTASELHGAPTETPD